MWSWLTRDERARLIAWARFRASWNRDLPVSRGWLAAAGFPLSLAVAIYTGVLLGAVQARPLWNTNLVAQMFLFSAISTGCARLIVVLGLGRTQREAG